MFTQETQTETETLFVVDIFLNGHYQGTTALMAYNFSDACRILKRQHRREPVFEYKLNPNQSSFTHWVCE